MVGRLTLLRDGELVRLRTRQQALLLARLAVHAPSPLARAETAALLWPDAPRSNALTYLRRAVMELRELGIDVAATREELSLGAGAIASDLDEPSVAGRPFLEGIDHAVADELRPLAAKRRKRGGITKAKSEPSLGGAETWLSEALFRAKPEVALELLAGEGSSLLAQRPPAEALRLCERVLASSPEPSSSRNVVLNFAGRACMHLTRYGRAEAYFEEALQEARRSGDGKIEARVLTSYGFMCMETRRWDAAVEMGSQAVEIAEALDDPFLILLADVNLAGVKWHLLDFAGAERHYRRAASLTRTDAESLNVDSNHAYLWAVFDVPYEPTHACVAQTSHPSGQSGATEAYLYFSLHLGFGELRLASEWAARLLDVMADEGKERYLCIALDCAAIVLGKLGPKNEAAAVVRIGSRLRWSLGHRRSPAEALAIRRHVGGGFFAPETTRLLATLDDEDPARTAHRLANRLRLHALG